MAAEQINFEQLLNDLLATDNETRRQAEETYNNLSRDVKMTHLLAAIHNGQISEEARLMAAVVLRRLLSSDFLDFYNELPQEAKEQFLQQILLAVDLEVTCNLRRKICEVLVEIARNLIDDDGNNQWPYFLQFLFRCANSPISFHQEAALRIFVEVPEIFGNQQSQYLELIKEMLQKSLDPSADCEIRFLAVRAVAALILDDEDTPIYKHFSDLLPRMIAITAESVQAHDDQSLIKLLIDLSEGCPKFLRPQLEVIFEMCMKVFSSTEVQDHLRHLALEVMVELSKNDAPMVRKKATKYIVALIPLILSMLTDLDDDKVVACDAVAREAMRYNNVIATTSLERLASSLGGHIIVQYVVDALPNILSNNTNWMHRHAALMAITTIGEGSRKQMEATLDDVIKCVLAFMNEPHPQIRYTACTAIGRMSTDFAPIFEKKFHEQIIPGLLSLMDDIEHPRVQAYAGAALATFNRECPKCILTCYLHGVMNKLEDILNTKFKELVEKGNKLVLEQVVATITSVAGTCGEEFAIYYDRLMPFLKFVIQNANIEELRMLRGRAIECVTIIGMAVGREKFLSDSTDVIDMLLKIQTEDDPKDNPQSCYLIPAWARLCKILGKRFEQYLPLIMESILQIAATKPDIAFLNEEEADDIKLDKNWTIFCMDEDEYYAIRTACMDDKALACEILMCFAQELKRGFANYIDEVLHLIVPLLFYYYHNPVRSVAAKCLPHFLNCAKIKSQQFFREMWLFTCPELIIAMKNESEPKIQSEMLRSFAKSVEVMGPNCLLRNDMNEVINIIAKNMSDYFEKADKRTQIRKEEDYDDDVEEILATGNYVGEDLLPDITDIVHALLLTYKHNFLQYFDRIVHFFIKLLDPSRTSAEKRYGLFIFDKVIEYCGPRCTRYEQVFTQTMLQYVTDQSSEVRTAAAYGYGALGKFGGKKFAVACARAIPLLMKIVNAPRSREPENIRPTENAISAVAKILKFNSSSLRNRHDIIKLWLSWLPVREDKNEIPHIYGFFCDLIRAKHPVVVVNNNFPRLITIIADAFSAGVVSPTSEVGTRMVRIVKQIKSKMQNFEACVGALSPEEKHALEEACQDKSSVS